MYYYEVWPRTQRYHSNRALTYQSTNQLRVGSLVVVQLQQETIPAIVIKSVKKPSFVTKPLETIDYLPPLPQQIIQLGTWLASYYPSPLGVIAQQLLPPNFGTIEIKQPKISYKPARYKLPTLTVDQTKALSQITKSDTYLLHGITGSGKTRLYIELAIKTVAQQRSVIILTPEISLTAQLAKNFSAVFGKQVIILHSQLTIKARQMVWQMILRADKPLVVIGPRSALFSPLKNVGLIVIDESHEPAYKQEQAPHYQATRVAAKLSSLHNATLVFGSATPLVTDYYLAQQKHKLILRLNSLAKVSDHPSTEVTVVDIKNRSLFGSGSVYLSRPLLSAIQTALAQNEQTLLYLNRRGTARLILCENCGWQATCPHCALPLTYHGDSHRLRCHVCNFQLPTPVNCPSCNLASIIFRTVGTKAIVDEVQRLFPGASVQRFDTDNKKAERFEQHFQAVHSGAVDILVGTQLLAKGLDLPHLGVLGILIADTSLQIPDYSAQERTYQLLSQVLGRVGRGHRAGRAIIQSYQPDHPVIQAILDDDWDQFYQNELAARRKFLFPPFCQLLKLTVRRASVNSAQKAANTLVSTIQKSGLSVKIEGPAAAFHEKFQNKYQWQLVIKAKERSQLIAVIGLLPSSSWSYDIDPVDLL
ncbi:MAG TPA: primosomal protein N' [Candidatus Dormibacteraeota bacterium]|nr:primosomal protein N' [Candidatus Dormibacteraeota bacterium]